MSADAALPGMGEIAGCHLADRVPAGRSGRLRFVRAWGPFKPGDELVLPDGDGSLGTRWARLAVDDGDVIATDADGGAALVLAHRGLGLVATCAAPVELLLAGRPGAHGPDDRSWGLYAGLLDEAAIREAVSVDHPDLTCGNLRGQRGGLVAVTNHGAAPAHVQLRLPADAADVRSFGPSGVASVDVGQPGGPVVAVELELDGHAVTLIGWDDRA
jgi:hypothetical protein